MLDGHLQHQNRRVAVVNGFLPVGNRVVGEIFFGQQSDGMAFFFLCLQKTDLAEGNHTAVIGGILIWNNLILVDDAKGCFGLTLDGIDFMAGFGTVKIKLSFGVDKR